MPAFSDLLIARPPRAVDTLDLDTLERGGLHRLRVAISRDGVGNDVRVPVIVARGAEDGPVVGITAAVHGNELNGIPTIHRLVRTLDVAALKGTVVGVPVVNVPGYLRNIREFHDGRDLNRLFPGAPAGNGAQVYAHAIMTRIVKHFGVLVDLHTASFGRVNSLYIRADLSDPRVARYARLIGPQIIVHNPRGDGTLRGAASASGICALTVEVGDPQRLQRSLTKTSGLGIRNIIEDLGMIAPDAWDGDQDPVICSSSYWTYTDEGGLLDVLPKLAQTVAKDEVVAHLFDPWGARIAIYRAPEDGIVIGKSTNPVADVGARILHLGKVAPPGTEFPPRT